MIVGSGKVPRIRLIERPDELQKHRAAAREQAARLYGFDATYGMMAQIVRDLAKG